MNKNFKYLLFLLFLLKKELFTRVFQTPLYYNNNGYVLFTKKYIENIAKSYNFSDDPIYEFDFIGTGFYRVARYSFNKWGQLRGLATIINGVDTFDISDLFYDSQTPILSGKKNLKHNPLNENEWLYIDGKVSPNYLLTQRGCILGIDFSRRASEDYAFTFRARLPIKNIVLNNFNGWRNVSPEEEYINTYDECPPINDFKSEYIINTISGFYKNGVQSAWEYSNISGQGDLNLELDFIKSFFDNKLIWYLIGGLICPTGIKNKNDNDYLSLFTGNNGHFGLRVGTQFSWDVISTINLVLYGSYEYSLPANEFIIATYKDAYAYGMQPDYVDAKISWNSVILSADIVAQVTEFFGATVGYQFFYKDNDKISSNQKTISDAVGVIRNLDFNIMEFKSKRIANKIRGSLFADLKDDFQFEFGADFIVYGSNIMQENEIFIRLSYSF